MFTDAELAALQFYSGSGYRAINDLLRGERPRTADLASMIAQIDAALAKSSLTTDLSVFRGIAADIAQPLLAGVRVGSVLQDAAFISTSPLLLTARIFSAWPPGGAILRIKLQSGMSAIDMAGFSQHPEEREMLLPRDIGLRITGIEGMMIEAEAF